MNYGDHDAWEVDFKGQWWLNGWSLSDMNKALEAHAIISLFVMYSPIFDKARADPRYLELVERIRKQTGITK